MEMSCALTAAARRLQQVYRISASSPVQQPPQLAACSEPLYELKMAKPNTVTMALMLLASLTFSSGYLTVHMPAGTQQSKGNEQQGAGEAQSEGASASSGCRARGCHSPSFTPSQNSEIMVCMPAPVFCMMAQFTAEDDRKKAPGSKSADALR